LIVFAGPPLSGKSALSTAIESKYREQDPDSVTRIAMDDIRSTTLKDSDHTKPDRNIAYRRTLSEADKALRNNKSRIILDATYMPLEHRQALAELAKKWSVGIYLVECQVSPEDAVDRFWHRPHGHAGRDLTATRVRDIAAKFQFYGGGLLVDTSKDTVENCVASIDIYLNQSPPLCSPDDWAKATLIDEEKAQLRRRTKKQSDVKISPVSRGKARNNLIGYAILFVFAGILFLFGFAELFLAYLYKSNYLSGTATADMTTGLFIFAVPPVYYLLEKPIKRSLGILRFGSEPAYGPLKEIHRSNRELYREYRERTANTKPADGFLIDAFPVYFVIQPTKDRKFDVIVKQISEDPKTTQDRLHRIRAEAAEMGFDWDTYRRWRVKQKASEYFGGEVSTKTLRAIRLPDKFEERLLEIEGAAMEYSDYLVAEQSVNLEVPGQLPYMREFFEGRSWWTKTVNLDSVEVAGERYSMMVGVTVLIITRDNFVIFQRRSRQVQSGQGGLTVGASGGVDWNDVDGGILGGIVSWEGHIPRIRKGNERKSLRNAVFREIREELGLLRTDFENDETPFIAAAFNLKYGRDLNFYAVLHCNLKKDKVSRLFSERRLEEENRGGWLSNFFYSAGRDRWEVAHLKFMPLSWLQNDDDATVSKREAFLEDARHAHGIVKALRIFNGWESSQTSA
jgi:predicted kinase